VEETGIDTSVCTWISLNYLLYTKGNMQFSDFYNDENKANMTVTLTILTVQTEILPVPSQVLATCPEMLFLKTHQRVKIKHSQQLLFNLICLSFS